MDCLGDPVLGGNLVYHGEDICRGRVLISNLDFIQIVVAKLIGPNQITTMQHNEIKLKVT